MDKATQAEFLNLIEADRFGEAIEALLDWLPDGHPDRNRIQQLRKRERELSDRLEMGTFSKEDAARAQARIKGGLRDAVHEIRRRPAADAGKPDPDKKPTFKLNLQPEAGEPDAAPVDKGFFGTVDYAGSPSKQERTVTLPKTYGAAFHICREAIRQAGMQMESADRDGGRLEASLPSTGVGSYGEKILMWVTPLPGGKTTVHVVVDSQLSTQVFDFGRNKQKLGILCSYLR